MLDLIQLSKELEVSEILTLIESKIQTSFEKNPQELFNFLYRFDLAEYKVAPLLSKKDYKAVAVLIWERQEKKMEQWGGNNEQK